MQIGIFVFFKFFTHCRQEQSLKMLNEDQEAGQYYIQQQQSMYDFHVFHDSHTNS